MKKFLFFLWLTTTVCLVQAQDNRQARFNPEEFKAKLENYITQRAELTKSEAEKFFPIFHEMKEKQRSLTKKAQELKRKHPAATATDKEYSDIVNQLAELDAEVAKVEATYYKKLCKAVSPKKVYAALLADDAFHREMLQRFDGKRQQQQNRQHQGERK